MVDLVDFGGVVLVVGGIMNLPKFQESSGFASELLSVAQMFWLFNVGPSSLCVVLATFYKTKQCGA